MIKQHIASKRMMAALGILALQSGVSPLFAESAATESLKTGSRDESRSEPAQKMDEAKTVSLSDVQFDKKITDFLNRNPKVVVEALQKFSEEQQRAQQEKMQASLLAHREEIARDSYAAVLGKKDSDTKLVVFLDPNCPHCRHFEQAINKVRENFPDVAILLRHWAILGKDSEDLARGLWAIKMQGQDKYDAISRVIAGSEEPYTYARLLAWATEQKLDIKKFEDDAQSGATRNIVAKTHTLAQELGLQGTPTSVLIDKKGIRLVMPTDEKSLEAILKEGTKA